VQLLPDPPDVAACLAVAVWPPVEEVERFGPVGFGGEHVVERQAQLVAEVADRGVGLIDELAAALDDLSGVKVSAQRAATPARFRLPLEHRSGKPGLV
jgi:hypothetical protein